MKIALFSCVLCPETEKFDVSIVGCEWSNHFGSSLGSFMESTLKKFKDRSESHDTVIHDQGCIGNSV